MFVHEKYTSLIFYDTKSPRYISNAKHQPC